MDISRKSAIKLLGAVASSGVSILGVNVPIAQALDLPVDIAGKFNVAFGPLLGLEQFSHIERLGRLSPRRSETIASSRWALHFNANRIPNDKIDVALDKIAGSGVKWARLYTRGYAISSEENYYQWEFLDKIIHGLHTRKISSYININNRGIDLYESNPDGAVLADSKKLAEYLDAVAALIQRYHNKVKYWEIFNEPDITPAYNKVVREASKVIKQIDPDAKVLAGSLARSGGFVKQIDKLLSGAGAYIDIITFHAYNEFPEALKYHCEVPITGAVNGGYMATSVLLEDMRKQVDKTSRPIELWQGEAGYPSSAHTQGWKGSGPWGEYIQAKWLLRRLLIDYSMDLPVSTCFILQKTSKGGKVNAKQILYQRTWKEKPVYNALQHVTSIFDERLNSPGKVQSELEIIDDGGFTGIAGENDNEYLRANTPYEHAKSPHPIEIVGLMGNEGDAVTYWVPWRMQEYVKPGKVNILLKNVDISKPVLVDLLTGDIYHVSIKNRNRGMLLKHIPIADYPMAIVPRDLVKMR